MSKANCLVAQSGGPTAVINSSLYGVIMEASNSSKIDKVYGGINGIEGILKKKIIDIFEIPYDRINNMKFTPSAALGSCRYRLKDYKENDEEYRKLFDIFKEFNIKYFFYIGGNDSMETVYKIHSYAQEIGFEINVIGIPKTIDNDLLLTDHSPGFGSAAKFIATVTLELALDGEAYETKTINVMEVMGRNAGWLAASSALVKDKLPNLRHLIYLPEVPFSEEKFLEEVNQAYKEYGNVFITVSEGIKDEKGNYIETGAGSYKQDSFGHRQLGGVGDYIEYLVKQKIYKRVRMTRLGFTQRSALHFASQVDFEEAEKVGRKAVQFALSGESGKMVAIVRDSDAPYTIHFETVDAEKVCNAEKLIPASWITEDGTYVKDEFFRYARPLIQGEVKIPIDGLPNYISLKHQYNLW
jgi:6-phosphofructokinase 1